MKILALLWTVCLARFCSAFWCCGGSKTNDDEVTVRTVQGGSNEVSTENLRAVPPQQPVESPPQPTEPKEVSTETSQSAEQVNTNPIILDLASPDEAEIVVKENKESEVSLKEYYPNSDAFHISSVMDGGVTLWMAGTGEISGFVTSYTRGNSTLITIGISKGSDSKPDFKYFEKLYGEWNELSENEFFNKFD